MRGISVISAASVSNSKRRFIGQKIGLTAALLNAMYLPLGLAATSKRRLVSIGGGLTEIVYALGAEADLVGVDTTSLFPAQATKLPSVGYARALSLEGVLSLTPTQVIATEDAGPPAVVREINKAGVPLATLTSNHQFEGLLDRIQRVGALTDRQQNASQLVKKLQGEWPSIQKRIASRNRQSLRILFVLAHTTNQVMVAGQNTSAEAMIHYVGASNAITGFTGYKPITPEAVVAAQPDIILLTEQGLSAFGSLSNVMKLSGLQQTPAGRKQRIVSMEAMYLLGFGPRLLGAITELDSLLVKLQ